MFILVLVISWKDSELLFLSLTATPRLTTMMSCTFLLPHCTHDPFVSIPKTTRMSETLRESERARLSTIIISYQERTRHTHIRVHKTLIPPCKARPVRLVVQAWGEETFAVLERLCRSGLFSLLCCVSVPSERLRLALSPSSYRLTPPWHLKKKRGGGRYLCVSVYRPLSHSLVPRQHSDTGNIQDGHCVICFHINAHGDCSSVGTTAVSGAILMFN